MLSCPRSRMPWLPDVRTQAAVCRSSGPIHHLAIADIACQMPVVLSLILFLLCSCS